MTTVDIQSGETIPVSTELVPATIASEIGTLQITSDPQGANIFLDNVYQGITPLTISSLNAGTHTLVLRLPGYNDYHCLSYNCSRAVASSPGSPLPCCYPNWFRIANRNRGSTDRTVDIERERK